MPLAFSFKPGTDPESKTNPRGETMAEMTDAICMALSTGRDPKAFRAALRKQKFKWHVPSSRWIVTVGSPEHRDMEAVLDKMKEPE